MHPYQGDVGAFHRPVRGADAGRNAPGFNDADCLAFVYAVQAADGREYAGMDIRQHQAVDEHFAGLRSAGFNGLLDSADIPAEHQQKLTRADSLADQQIDVGAFQHRIAEFHSFGNAGEF